MSSYKYFLCNLQQNSVLFISKRFIVLYLKEFVAVLYFSIILYIYIAIIACKII